MKRLLFALLLLSTNPCFAQQATPVTAPGFASTPRQIVQKKEILYRVIDPAAPVDPTVQMMDVVIGKGGTRDLHISLTWPTAPPVPGHPLPAILFVHGGGWYSGPYTANPAVGYAKKGYFTGSIEYRLTPEAKWPAQIEDCKLAIRWLRANAAKYNVDPNRIGVWGMSAGGHLVALLGSTDDQPQLEGTGGYPGVSSKVQAVVDFFGPTDLRDGTFTTGIDTMTDAERDKLAQLPVQLIGKTLKEAPELYAQASPITYVHQGMPPFLVVHGDKDPAVSLQQSKTFVEAMQKVGAPVEFITVRNGGHGLGSVVPGQLSIPNADDAERVMDAFWEKNLQNKPQ
ncbi:MAG: alpha/beta hydrolase [Chthoniobacterales bacterium]